jgi:hypothetical protein
LELEYRKTLCTELMGSEKYTNTNILAQADTPNMVDTA